MAKLKNILKKRLSSQMKLGTEKTKPYLAETLELCLNQLENIKGRESITKKHRRLAKVLVTEMEKAHGNQGTLFLSLADYVRAKTQFEKALAVHKATGNRGAQASIILPMSWKCL